MLSFTAAETVSTHCAEQRELALSWLSANWTGAGASPCQELPYPVE